MILDSSAILAILFSEDDAPVFAESISRAETRRVSAAIWLESAIRVDSEGSSIASKDFDDFVREAGLTIEPVTEEQVRIARSAYRAFGKGSGHPAQLNFGDCFSYALARITGEPLLFKGRDFSRTDVETALPDGES